MAVSGQTPEKSIMKLRKKRRRAGGTEVVWPAAAAHPIPSRDDLSEISADGQDSVVDKLGVCNERLVSLMTACVEAHRKDKQLGDDTGHVVSVEDMLLSDMARLKDVSAGREFVECTLWRRVRTLNTKLMSGGVGRDPELLGNGVEAKVVRAPAFETLRQAHLSSMTERYAKDLEKLHEKEDMDSDRVTLLLRCLEQGADLFAAYRS